MAALRSTLQRIAFLRSEMLPYRKTPSFRSLAAASKTASEVARSSSRKRDTGCELLLRKELSRLRLRYRVDVAITGRPDIVFRKARIAIFCDGDFWHGRNLDEREGKLRGGHNAAYWIEKIRSNVARDRRNTVALEQEGWVVLRLWETDIKRDPGAAAARVDRLVRERLSAGLVFQKPRERVVPGIASDDDAV